MKLGFLTLISVLMLGGISCTKSQVGANPVLGGIASGGCALEKVAEIDLAATVTKSTGCTGTAAIQADITKLLGNIGFCRLVDAAQAQKASGTLSTRGVMASLLCTPVINGLTGLFTASLNPEYGCPATPAGDIAKLQLMAITACQLLPY